MRDALSNSEAGDHSPHPWQSGISALLLIWLLYACSSQSGIYHTVAQGQTLYRISRAYGVDERYLARINRIEDPTHLRAGQRLFIPGADRPRTIADPPAVASSSPAAPGGPKPVHVPSGEKPAGSRQSSAKSPDKSAPPISRATPTPPPDHPARTAIPDRPAEAGVAGAHTKYQGKFLWPLKGEVVRRFGDAGNPPCKGLEISATRGTPVLSAAPGHVIYSGDGIRSYGNLVILRHDDDFFTVYGYNDSNLVKAGNFVSKGDRIALSGVSPGGGAPRLYFEIRRGKEPVNPIFYLP